jgi:AcrR family transcriptional regulator
MLPEAMATPRTRSRGTPGRIDDLVAVAARLFHERGYDATSMQEIADEMGILKGSLYHYVVTKEDLLWMIVQAPLQELLDEVKAALSDESMPVSARIRRAVTVHCESFDRHHPHMSVITREYGETLSPGMREQIAAMREEYYSSWKKAIASGQRTGELRSDIDSAIATEAILGMVNWMFRWYKPGGRLTATKVADQFAELLDRGLVVAA